MDVCLFRAHLWVDVSFLIHLFVDVAVQSAFMGGCTFSEYIYGWVCYFRTNLRVDVGVWNCLKFVFGWV